MGRGPRRGNQPRAIEAHISAQEGAHLLPPHQVSGQGQILLL